MNVFDIIYEVFQTVINIFQMSAVVRPVTMSSRSDHRWLTQLWSLAYGCFSGCCPNTNSSAGLQRRLTLMTSSHQRTSSGRHGNKLSRRFSNTNRCMRAGLALTAQITYQSISIRSSVTAAWMWVSHGHMFSMNWRHVAPPPPQRAVQAHRALNCL